MQNSPGRIPIATGRSAHAHTGAIRPWERNLSSSGFVDTAGERSCRTVATLALATRELLAWRSDRQHLLYSCRTSIGRLVELLIESSIH